MLITPQTTFTLRRNYMLFSTPSGDGIKEVCEAKVLYNYYPAIQEAVSCFVEILAEKYALSAFGSLCTQCGNCCRQDNILVQGADIFKIALELGLSIEKFRKRYLKPARTWNEYDGYIKLKKGKCPFLKQNPSGCYACSIYNCRPQSCRMFPPMGQFCRKDPGYLLQYLDEVVIHGDDIRISINTPVSDGSESIRNYVFNYKLEDESLRRNLEEIRKAAESVQGESIDLVEGAVRKAEVVMQRFIDNFENETKKDKFGERVQQLRDIVADLDAITAREDDSSPPLDEVWKKMRIIDAMARGEYLSGGSDMQQANNTDVPLASKGEMEISSLTIYPEIAAINFKFQGMISPYPVHLSSSPEILQAIRDLVKTVVTLEGDQHQILISEPEPICYLCGDCCAQFGIEIQPSDIRRFADNMKMTVDEVRAQYLDQHKYSWNRADACMKKRKMPGEDVHKCVLLEKREDSFYYCSVHSYKPDVCRQFAPTHNLCRKVNNIPYWHRLPRNIMRIDLSGSRLVLHTFRTHNSMSQGEEIQWRQEAALSQVVDKLAETIISVFSRTGGNGKKESDNKTKELFEQK